MTLLILIAVMVMIAIAIISAVVCKVAEIIENRETAKLENEYVFESRNSNGETVYYKGGQ